MNRFCIIINSIFICLASLGFILWFVYMKNYNKTFIEFIGLGFGLCYGAAMTTWISFICEFVRFQKQYRKNKMEMEVLLKRLNRFN